MKKSFVFIAIIAALLSCSKEGKVNETPAKHQDETNELVAMSFNAVADEANALVTATSLSGNAVVWSTSDKINVFSGASFGTNTQFSVTSVANEGREATFDGLALVSPEYYALSPYQAGATITAAGVITAELPAAQAAVAGSFGPEANLSVAHIAGSEELVFKNVGALVGVTIGDANVTGLKIQALGGGSLSGTANINYNGGEPSVSVTSGNDYVETAVSGTGTYYFIVYPGVYTGGFRITVSRGGYKATIDKTADLTLERNDNKLLANIASVPSNAWKVVFTPGERVFIKGIADANENGQEVSYISSDYYDPSPSYNSGATPGSRGDNSAISSITYNYEVWAKIAETDKVYFESESGARFSINAAGTAIEPIAPDGEGTALSVSNSPYRMRINLPSGDAQLMRVGIANYGIIFGNVSENLTYDRAGAWKLDNYTFQYATNQGWDSTLHRYRFRIWFNWQGGKGGSGCDIWQTYGTCTAVNNTNTEPNTDDPTDPYYFLQPFNDPEGNTWDAILYLKMSRLFNGGVNGTRKGTINLYMNNTYGHFTHSFSDVVDL